MKTQRWRITFSKTEAMRFISHLDLILTWERTFRRSGLPLSYSEGFNPRPVINLAAPLPLGFTSSGEIGDFWLSEIVSLEEFTAALNRSTPPGLEILQTEEISQLHGDKLPSLVQSAEYRLDLANPVPDLSERVASLLGSSEIVRTRKGKEYDLRPLILGLSSSDPSVLSVTLSLLPGATGRPDEVLAALGIPAVSALICRKKINLKPSPQ